MRSSIWLKLFDRERDFVANKVMTLGGVDHVPGDPIDKTLVNTRRLRQMYEARKIRMVEVLEAVETEIQQIGDDIAEGWRDLPWLPEEKGGPTIRQLAAKFTTGALRNKDAAIAVIEAELARREAALNPPAADEVPADELPPAPEPEPVPAVDPEPAADPAPEPETAPSADETPAPVEQPAETVEPGADTTETDPAEGTDGQPA